MIDLQLIIDKFEEFSNNHAQVKSFGYGPIRDIQSKERQYPLVFISSKPGELLEGATFMNFDVYILTNQAQDETNLQSSMNDMLYIGRDLIDAFKMSDITDGFEFNKRVEYGPITFDFDDVLGGWDFTINIEIPYNGGCYIPND
jgi:hypothetical protein